MKTFVRLLLILVVVVAIALWFSSQIVAKVAKSAIEQATGFGVDIGDVQVDVMRPMVKISNLKLSNPPEFPHPEALTVHEAMVELEWGTLFSSTVRVRNVTIDIPRVVMVRTPQGSNMDALTKGGKEGESSAPKPKPEAGDQAGKPAEQTAKKSSPPRSIVIDELKVKFGEMEVRQYRRSGEEPSVLTVPVGMDRSYSNVTNIQAVGVQLASELVVLSGVSIFQQLDASLKKLNEKTEGSDEKVKEVISGLKGLFEQKKP